MLKLYTRFGMKCYVEANSPQFVPGRRVSQVKALKEKTGSVPHLAIVTVGERPPAEALR